jgi:DNA-binding LacI/PurR family transcriptional regulator
MCGPAWRQPNFPELFSAFLDEHKPTALFFNNDAAAFRALQLLEQRGMRVPQDISVAGFDGIWLPFDYNPLNLTTVVQDFTRLGKEAGRAVVEMIQYPKREPLHIRVPVRLHTGKTSASPKGIIERKESPI